MKKLFITMAVAGLTMLTASAQQTAAKPERSVYVELLGASNLVGINYDARFKAASPWGYRVGLGYTNSRQYNMFWGSNSLSGPTVPLELNYLLGRKRSHLDLGFGLNLGYYTQKYGKLRVTGVDTTGDIPIYHTEYAGEDRLSAWGYYFFGNIGYRYQPAHGFQFRAGLNPAFHLGGSHAVTKSVFPYVSFGFVF